MGAGIAEVCARADLDVRLVEVDGDAAGRARRRIAASVRWAVSRGKLEASAGDAKLASVDCGSDFDALADRELVIEAVIEDRSAKLDVVRRLSDVPTGDDVILASNTSSIPIVELAAACGDRSEHVLGLHFFSPVPVLSLSR
jgi:3-hydroxybutyryl-CoA dehydrogenase